jgi:uncharacterized protein (TIGR02996 family)
LDGDGPFLVKLRAHPSDDELRLVYADWLVDRGDPASLAKAAFLRAQVAGAPMQDTPPVEPDWLGRVDRTTIENCRLPWPQRRYCPQQWQELIPRGRSGRIRFCAECGREVHHCASPEEVGALVEQGWCVAVSSRLRGEPPDLEVLDGEVAAGEE